MPLRLLISAFVWLAAAGAQQPGTIAIDTQEWRDAPARHLYIHGTLNGDTAFHVFLPARELWKGRLMQYLQGGLGGSEREGVRMGNHNYALANGAAYVESSQGHTGGTFYEPNNSPSELAYEASYAVVQYAKSRCVELYGREPAYTYVFGGSGGGLRSTGLLERFPKVYDGAVPIVGAGAVHYFYFIHSWMEEFRPAIQPLIPAIAEATRVPWSGDPFSVLKTPEQRQALREVLSAGYPKNSLWLLRPLGVSMVVLDYLKYKLYPAYFEEFWKTPGFEGAEGKVKSELVEGLTGAVRSIAGEGRQITTDLARPNEEFFGYTVTFTSGALAGQWRRVLTNKGGTLMLNSVGPDAAGARPGDAFRLDNRDLLAFRALHRHIIDDAKDPVMRKFVGRDGRPAHVQISAEALAELEEPGRTIGSFKGKMIAVFGTDDPLMWPTIAFRYHARARQAFGAAFDDHFRLHFLEHGVHGAPIPSAPHRQIPNQPAVRKALDDLMAWVERGNAPAAGTQYSIDEFNQIVLPGTAAQRKGYQPLVWLRAARAAQDAILEVEAEDPDNEVVRVDIDFEGDGKFDETRAVRGKRISSAFRHDYPGPGVYYPTARVVDSTVSPATNPAGIQNLATVRVEIK